MNQMQQMMIQAQKMQREMQKAFDEIDKKEYNVSDIDAFYDFLVEF